MEVHTVYDETEKEFCTAGQMPGRGLCRHANPGATVRIRKFKHKVDVWTHIPTDGIHQRRHFKRSPVLRSFRRKSIHTSSLRAARSIGTGGIHPVSFSILLKCKNCMQPTPGNAFAPPTHRRHAFGAKFAFVDGRAPGKAKRKARRRPKIAELFPRPSQLCRYQYCTSQLERRDLPTHRRGPISHFSSPIHITPRRESVVDKAFSPPSAENRGTSTRVSPSEFDDACLSGWPASISVMDRPVQSAARVRLFACAPIAEVGDGAQSPG